MGKQGSDIAFQKSSLLAKVFGDNDEKVLDANVKYFKALYREDKGRAIKEYLDFIDRLNSQALPVKKHLKTLGEWIDGSGFELPDYRDRYLELLSRCYGEKSVEYELEFGLFAKDCYQAKEYERYISLINRKKAVCGLSLSETLNLFESYYKLKRYSYAYQVGIEVKQEVIRSSGESSAVAFSLKLIECCYCSENKKETCAVIESLRNAGIDIYGFIDRNVDEYGYFVSYIYSGYLCSGSVSDLRKSALKCFAKSEYINDRFFFNSAKQLKEYIDRWKEENGYLLYENEDSVQIKRFADELYDIFRISYEHMSTCRDKDISIDFDLLAYCFEIIRYARSISYLSLKILMLSDLIQSGTELSNCSDLFSIYEGISNSYSNEKKAKESPCLILLAARLGDFTHKHIDELTERKNCSDKAVLEMADEYYSDAYDMNQSLNVYSEKEMDSLLKGWKKVSSRLESINDYNTHKKEMLVRAKRANRAIGFSYLGFALSAVAFYAVNALYLHLTNLIIGLVTGTVLLAVNFGIHRTKPIVKTITNGIFLVASVVLRLIMGKSNSFVFLCTNASLIIAFIGTSFSSRLKEVYGENKYDLINITLTVLCIFASLILGFSFSWYVWQWILGGLFGLLLIVVQIMSIDADPENVPGIVFLGISLLLNFILLAIFKANYHQVFELLSIAIGICAAINLFSGFVNSESGPIYLGIGILLLNMFSLIPWASITANSNQAILSVLLGYKWAIGEWIIGISFGIAIVGVPVFVMCDVDEEDGLITSIITLAVSLIANFVLYFIFKTQYYLVFQLVSLAIEAGAVISIIIGIIQDEELGFIGGAIIGVLNLLSLFVWSKIMKSGVQDAIIWGKTVQDVVYSSGAVSVQRAYSEWWKWPVGVLGALVILATSFIPNGCLLAVVFYLANCLILQGYGYPGGYDIFFKCFTFGIGLSCLVGVFHPESKWWARILCVLIEICCVSVILNFDRWMTRFVAI